MSKITMVRNVRRGARLPKPFKIAGERVVVEVLEEGKHVAKVDRPQTVRVLRGRGYRQVEAASPASPPNTGAKPNAGSVSRGAAKEASKATATKTPKKAPKKKAPKKADKASD